MDKILDPERLAHVGQQLREELGSSGRLADDWIRRAAKALVEQMLTAEVDEHLGRVSYQRREDQQVGYRNGYKSRSLKTAEGEVGVEVPQVRGLVDGPYQSPIWQALSKRSPALQKLAVEMYARGLSTRDIEDLLSELCQEQEDQEGPMLLSKSSVSRVTEALWEEYEAFTKRDLAEFDVVYLFCDAVYESLRRHGCGCGLKQKGVAAGSTRSRTFWIRCRMRCGSRCCVSCRTCVTRPTMTAAKSVRCS